MRNVSKLSLRDRLICLEDFVGMTQLTLSFLQPLPNCFLKVCPPILFAALLILFLPLTTSAITRTANSNKSAPTCFAAGTIYLRKNGIYASSPNDLCKCTESSSTLSTNSSTKWNLYLS